MTTYRYTERDEETGGILWDVTGSSLDEMAEKIGMDIEDATNLWAGVLPGSPVIDRDMSGKDGITYSREFHCDA
jgi:hypothetical protein